MGVIYPSFIALAKSKFATRAPQGIHAFTSYVIVRYSQQVQTIAK